jgi:ubiquinone/menaquinone biosynthesis C-methylase UbiE
MSWERFDQAASRYEGWYRTARGRRAAWTEGRLLGRLLTRFPSSRSTLEIGCGTAHFARWLAQEGFEVIGLDRSPAMLAEARRLAPGLPLSRADAQRLPFRNRSVDLAIFVTTLEFLASPSDALAEAVRVARAGVIVVALNRWSIGAFSRRWGSQAKGELLRHADNFSLPRLRAMLRSAADPRLRELHWASAVFPVPLCRVVAPIPLGEVLGIAAVLEGPPPLPSA